MKTYLRGITALIVCWQSVCCTSSSTTTTVTKPDGTVTTTTSQKKGVDKKALESGEAITTSAASIYLGSKAQSRQ